MRVFAAIELPAEAVADLRAALPPLPDGARPVAPERWHVTLAFYGDLPERSVDRLAQRLLRLGPRTAPLHLRLAGAGTFPRRVRAARVLWVEVTGDRHRLARLAASAAAAGRRVGAADTGRGFRPHLTVARCRTAPVDWSAAVDRLAGYRGPPWTARGATLLASEPGPSPRYLPLASVEFAGSAPTGADVLGAQPGGPPARPEEAPATTRQPSRPTT